MSSVCVPPLDMGYLSHHVGILEANAKVGWILLSELNKLSLAGSDLAAATARPGMILRLALLLFYLSLCPYYYQCFFIESLSVL